MKSWTIQYRSRPQAATSEGAKGKRVTRQIHRLTFQGTLLRALQEAAKVIRSSDPDAVEQVGAVTVTLKADTAAGLG